MRRNLKILSTVFMLFFLISVSYEALGKSPPLLEMEPVDAPDKIPYNAAGLIVGTRDFASAVSIGNPRLILTIAPASHDKFLDDYQWHSETLKQSNTQPVPLRRIWIFTGQKGYASYWHKRTTKLRPGLALLEAYEDLTPEEQVAKRATDPYDELALKSTPKLFVGYPQPDPTYPKAQSISPFSRSMSVGSLDGMSLSLLTNYRNQPFMTLNIAGAPNTPDRFSGCEGGPLLMQDKTGTWVAAGVFSTEIQAVQANESTLVFRILDEATYESLIKPAL